jgi:beta-glucanase (GH16 family)
MIHTGRLLTYITGMSPPCIIQKIRFDISGRGTNNLEWYDPMAVTTVDGSLKVTLDEFKSHDLNYQGGLLATWNKFCFTGGYIEGTLLFVILCEHELSATR